jgi:hypothetical protein
MNVAPIIARLKSQVTALKIVGGAADVEAALNALAASPAAFVIEQTDEGKKNELVPDVHQRVEVGLLILLAVSSAKDSRGEAGQSDLETLRGMAPNGPPTAGSVAAALLGWSPGAGIEPLEFAGGQLFRFSRGHIWWLDAWRTAHYIRSAV